MKRGVGVGASVVSVVSEVSVVSVVACVVSVVVTVGTEDSLVSGPILQDATEAQTDAMSAVLTTLLTIDFFILCLLGFRNNLHANDITNS